jgi:hypothetical protein
MSGSGRPAIIIDSGAVSPHEEGKVAAAPTSPSSSTKSNAPASTQGRVEPFGTI